MDGIELHITIELDAIFGGRILAIVTTDEWMKTDFFWTEERAIIHSRFVLLFMVTEANAKMENNKTVESGNVLQMPHNLHDRLPKDKCGNDTISMALPVGSSPASAKPLQKRIEIGECSNTLIIFIYLKSIRCPRMNLRRQSRQPEIKIELIQLIRCRTTILNSKRKTKRSSHRCPICIK